MTRTPTYQDADLILRAYELRRESVMRQSRDNINKSFWPKAYEEFLAITQPAHDFNASFRQTSSYWEMMYGFVRHGVVHPELFMESNAEGLFLFAKIEQFLERFRSEVSPTAFQNAQWVATQTETGKARLDMFRKRVTAVLKAK